MARYNVILKTMNVEGAGTNAHVAIELRGQYGRSGWIVLDNPGDDRERNSEDIYGFPLNVYPGDITEVALMLKQDDTDRPDWMLEHVAVIDFNTPNNQEWLFAYKNWIMIEGKTQWFAGPVLAQRQSLGPAPFAQYVGDGGGGAKPLGTGVSLQALEAGFKTDGARTLSVVSRSADKLDVFSSNRKGHVFTAAWEPAFGAQWKGWWRIGDLRAAPGSQVVAVSRSAHKAVCFHERHGIRPLLGQAE